MTEGRAVVLDASAVLALLQEEPGADEVESLMDAALMSSVNLAEVIQKAEQHGVNTEGLEYDLEALWIEFSDFDVAMARPTAVKAWGVKVYIDWARSGLIFKVAASSASVLS